MDGKSAPTPDAEPDENAEPEHILAGLDACPRCGQKVETIIWGQTNCPRCGLHFECC